MPQDKEYLIFRLQDDTDLSGSLKHWDDSTMFDEKKIRAIKSTNPDSTTDPTSIPSPFARIDLAKTAFGTVADEWDKAPKKYQKIVSDCLDVAEIFFNADKFKDKVEILIWDKGSDLQELFKEHKPLANTFNKFLVQDAKAYNFDRMQRIYLLNYIGPGKPNEINIIGATSPVTLFFSVSNDEGKKDDLSFVTKNIQFGNDKPFDSIYQPLFKRDFEFVKYIFAYRKSFERFATDFPEFNKYLDFNYRFLSDSEKAAIDLLDSNSITRYPCLTIGTSSNYVEILGKKFHKRPDNILIQSDFEIESDINNSLKPLVLPIEKGNTYAQLKYTQNNWDNEDKAPILDKRPWKDRTLPIVGDKYPYLTISDFLEDTIIRMPYEFNNNAYFNGNLDKNDGKSYLLPLTNLFFEFFTPAQLMGQMSDGKKAIELKSNAGGVTVVLRIPIKKGYIEYHRTYYDNNLPKVDEISNDGSLKENDFAFALFPAIRFTNANDAFYRLGLISNLKDSNNYSVSCFNRMNIIEDTKIIRDDTNSQYRKYQTHVLEGANFDYIQINCTNTKGTIIPKFKQQSGTDQYSFAVDFGTTNTHFEYSVNGTPSKAFDITKEDQQIQLLTYCERIEQYIFDFDFIPSTIGNNDEFKFPMRTALCEAKNANWNLAVHPMANANIPFPYEKRNEYKYNRIITGLKWSNDADNIKKIKCYVESLFLILRNKVILNNGNLDSTIIVWFYPISMTQGRFNKFKNIWEDAYLKYIGKNLKNVIPMTESVAPYEFFKGSIPSASDLVTIDIGGGTSDIVIAENGNLKYITSFRFAADSIFGDSYANNNKTIQNGLIRQFKNNIRKVLKDAQMDELINVLDTLEHNNISSNIASFLFSLKNNKRIHEKGITDNVDFNKILQTDNTQTIVFIFFYVALIYHLAHIMKAKKMRMPRHITFSGNGSKVIQILTTDPKLLEEFTKIIFEEIYGEKYHPNGLSIVYSVENPKEVTCKGGITCQLPQDYNQIEKTKLVLLNSNSKTFVTEETYSSLNDNKFIENSITQVKDFINFTIALNTKFSFNKKFESDNESLNIAKNVCFRDLETFAKKGVDEKMKEVAIEDTIEETTFFYPLNGMLDALSSAICENNLN